MKKTIIFNPFTRVEGDLQVEVEISEGAIKDARTSGTLYRGFENILRGRVPSDAIVITCRICGSCGATHAAAASAALADAYGLHPPPNGALARNVILGVETVLSHLSHFYFSFCADFATLSDEPEAQERFTPLEGNSYRAAVKARSGLTAILGLFAGKWPNTLAMQPGGSTRPVSLNELTRALGVLAEFRDFVEERMFADSLEGWLQNRSLRDLERWLAQARHAEGDVGLFLSLAEKRGLKTLGKGPPRFLACGGWSEADGTTWLRPGFYSEGVTHPCDPDQISEHVRYSWYQPYHGDRKPADGSTEPAPDKEGAYSWCKAPRYNGASVEVGPIARMVIDGDPLIVDAFKQFGTTVFTRMLARLHEIVRFVVQIEKWISAIDPNAPFYVKETPKDMASGCGLVEAPRGMLGHWVQIEKGRIRNYQVVTPTGWNLSPRDEHGQPGPLEMALVGIPVEDPERPLTLSHTVRSYDPCLFCTVH